MTIKEQLIDEEELLEEEEEEEEEDEEEDRGDEVTEEEESDEEEEEDKEEESDEEEEDKEEEEEDKEDEEEDEEEDDEDSKKSQMIPRARFDEVYGKFKTERERTRQLAEKVAQLEKGQDKGDPVEDVSKEIKDARKQMLKAIDDGKTEEAEQLMDKIDELNDKRIDQRLSESVKTSSKASTQEVEYNILVERIEDDFPVFDEASEHYDGDLVAEVLDIQQEFETAGNAPALALEKAMRYFKDEVEESMKGKGLIEPEEEVDTKKSLKSRKVESKKRNKKAKASQPAKSGGSEHKGDITVSDIVSMSEEEFDKLSETKLRELRGDLAV